MIRKLVPLLMLAMAVGCAAPAKHNKPPASAGGPAPASAPAVRPAPAPALTPAQRVDKTVRELTQRLALSPEQAEKVKAVLMEEQRKMDAIPPSSQTADPRKEMAKIFAQMRQIDQETQEELSRILTPAQMTGYEKYREEQRDRLHHDRLDGFGTSKPKKRNPRVPDGNLPRGLDPARR